MTGSASDMPARSWIDRWAPPASRPYLRLMRLDRPIGTWLLLFPCWWSLVLVQAEIGFDPAASLGFALLFGIGALVMRGAGCTINDLWDRQIDRAVARTRTRPIASGQIGVPAALAFLALQMLIGLLVLIQFNLPTVAWGGVSLLLVATYPLAKRVTYWPQAVLGLTFNWGALLGWTALAGEIAPAALILYCAGFFWTLGYDTIYAHQDKADDIEAGVKSTALRLGAASRVWVAGFYGLAWGLMVLAGSVAGLAPGWLLAALLPAAAHLIWQVAGWNIDDPRDCLRRFRANRDFGALVLVGLALALTVGALG